MAKAPKIDSPADIAFKVQKALKRISIDFSFLTNPIKIGAEDNQITFCSQIDSFRFFRAVFPKDYTEAYNQNNFLDYVSTLNNDRVILSLIQQEMKLLKGCRKMDMISAELSPSTYDIRFNNEGFEKVLKLHHLEKYHIERSRFEMLADLIDLCNQQKSVVSMDLPATDGPVLTAIYNSEKILEIPKSQLKGYSEGDFKMVFIPDRVDKQIINCRLEYLMNQNITAYMYFKAIVSRAFIH